MKGQQDKHIFDYDVTEHKDREINLAVYQRAEILIVDYFTNHDLSEDIAQRHPTKTYPEL